MLCADQSITIVSSWYDGATDTDREALFTLDGVSVFFGRSANASNSGVVSTDLVKIRIPLRDDYLSEDQWRESHPADKWTLQIGDKVIVNGQSMTLLRYHDNTARRFKPHWYLEVQ